MRHAVRMSLSTVFVPPNFACENCSTTFTKEVMVLVVSPQVELVALLAFAEETIAVIG